jgi:hypothetical protein
MRERNFRGGFHDFVIRKGGIVLFPRLIAAEHAGIKAAEPIRSNRATRDRMNSRVDISFHSMRSTHGTRRTPVRALCDEPVDQPQPTAARFSTTQRDARGGRA